MAVHMSKHLLFSVTQTINRIDSRAVSKNCSTKSLDDRVPASNQITFQIWSCHNGLRCFTIGVHYDHAHIWKLDSRGSSGGTPQLFAQFSIPL